MAEDDDATINPRTGLRETWHDFYDVPHVHQTGVSRMTLAGQPSAVHTVPLGDGLTLDFFANLKRSDTLIVTFSGALPREKNIYPMFWRVATFRGSTSALLAFADPTIMIDRHRKMRLSWFLGGPALDPAPAILQAIRRARGKAGAKHVVFVGGSGGGLPALRMSAMVPGSMAYIHEGATNVARSLPVSVDRYFSTVWPGWDKDKLIQAFPERFDMVRYYRSFQPDNFVYFAQSEDDPRFRENHYVPFKNAHGVKADSGVSRSGARHFTLYKGEVPGHGNVTPGEFKQIFGEASRLWREWLAKR